MSKIALAPAAAGTAIFTIESPGTSTNRTLTLPDDTGTIVTNSGNQAGSFTTLNTSGAVVFNDSGADVDFRVEGDTNTNLLFVDAGNDRVGIGINNPGRILDIRNDPNTSAVGNGMFCSTNSPGLTVAEIENTSIGLGSSGIVSNNAGDLHLRNFWGATVEVGAGGFTSGDSNSVEGTNSFSVRTYESGTFYNRFEVKQLTETVFNEDSQDRDFRVESDDNTHMLFVDAGNDAVVIGGATSGRTLTVSSNGGSISCNDANGGIYFGTAGGGGGGFGSNAAIARASVTGFHITSSVAGDFCIASEPNTNIRFGTSVSGTPSTRMTIAPSGAVAVIGALSKGSGSFKIDHPLPEKTETHHLVHSFIEGPQADLIYRGKVKLVAGRAEVNIDTVAGMTDGTFVALNREVQCFTSNESDWDAVRGSVSGNILTIECQNAESTATISWLVIGERQDKHMYDTDWTDENGKVIVEPLKPVEEVVEPTEESEVDEGQ